MSLHPVFGCGPPGFGVEIGGSLLGIGAVTATLCINATFTVSGCECTWVTRSTCHNVMVFDCWAGSETGDVRGVVADLVGEARRAKCVLLSIFEAVECVTA